LLKLRGAGDIRSGRSVRDRALGRSQVWRA
jgi:hypothetical protein